MSLAKRAVTLTANQAVHAVSHLAILMVAARALNATEYGGYRQYFLVYEVASPILALGLGQAIHFFLPRSTNQASVFLRSTLITIVSSLLGVIAIRAGLGFSGTDHVSVDLDLLWLAPFTATSLLVPLSLGVVLAKGRASTYVAINTALTLLLSIVVCGTLLGSGQAEPAIKVRIGTAIAISLVLWGFAFHLIKTERRGQVVPFSSLFRHAIPIGLASTVGMLSLQADKVIVSALGTTEEFAVFINGAMEIPLISIFVGAVATASLAEFSRILAVSDYSRAISTFNSIIRATSLLLLPILVSCMAVAPEAMVVLFGAEYEKSATPFRIYLLLLPARLIFYGPVLIALGQGRTILVRSIVELVLNVTLGLMLYHKLGMAGVALSTVFATYLWSVPYNLVNIKRGLRCGISDLVPIKALTSRLGSALCALPVLYLAKNLYGDGGAVDLVVRLACYMMTVLIIYMVTKQVNLRQIAKMVS